MLDAILRRFIPRYQDAGDPAVRERYGLQAGGFGLALNLLLFAVKLFAGLLTGAISVTADAFNNLSDAAGSAVTLAGFKLAAQRADERHPFGHGRIEYLAGLAVSLLILLVGVELGRGSVEKILRPAPSAPSALAVGLLAFSILVKVWMGWFYGALGRRAQSPALAAAAVDSRSDVLATSAVLAGLAVSSLFRVQLDGWLGLLVAALILRAGWEAARDTLDPLLGTPPDPAMVADIEKLILSDPQILGVHDLVVHDYGPGRRMMSVHAEVPAVFSLMEFRSVLDRPIMVFVGMVLFYGALGRRMMSVHAEVSAQCALLDIHAVIDRIERELAGQFQLEAVIHIDPVQPGDPRTRRLLALVEGLAQELDAAATVHDLRCGPEGEVSFDVVVPYDVPLTDGEVREAMERKVREREPGCIPVIGVDRSHVL